MDGNDELLALVAKRYDQLRVIQERADAALDELRVAQEALRAAQEELSKQQGPAGADGKDGRDGVDGKDGRDGADGKDGRDGVDGKDGADGKPPDHKWVGTKLAFEKPDGRWGKAVNLQGPPGEIAVVSSSQTVRRKGRERVWYTDYADTRFAYLGSKSTTTRIDYSVSPAIVEVALSGDWANRVNLTYMPLWELPEEYQ